MKRHITRALSLVGFPLLLLVTVPIVQADTDVYFTGNLVADPCELHVDSEDQIVDFRNVPSKTFIKYHRSERERFSIWLTECDLSLGDTVTVTFMGTEDVLQPGLFAVTGMAAGIAIAVEDADGTPVLPNVPMRPSALTAGDTYLNFQAFISAPVHSRVREGDFECVTTFLLEYD
ncbi:type 1 fimbrial protein [Raoultella terrigena]|uniref:fimbrial protein n=1 Tax=Raoultella terrigena TaxID=577 RepID=UPI002DB74D1C|nr:fimbrial protein [Raoultella terrigena]MEB8194999.1 type 1 fimbrial protein [Raoultella terrigena]